MAPIGKVTAPPLPVVVIGAEPEHEAVINIDADPTLDRKVVPTPRLV
jgi:hypothetical protein